MNEAYRGAKNRMAAIARTGDEAGTTRHKAVKAAGKAKEA